MCDKKKIRYCIICGKVITGRAKKYCSHCKEIVKEQYLLDLKIKRQRERAARYVGNSVVMPISAVNTLAKIFNTNYGAMSKIIDENRMNGLSVEAAEKIIRKNELMRCSK